MSTTNCPKHGYFDNRETQIDECPVCLKARVAELEAGLSKMYDQFWLTSENPGDDEANAEAKRLLNR